MHITNHKTNIMTERFFSATRLLAALVVALSAGISAIAGDNNSFNVASYNLRQLNEGDTQAGNGWAVREPVVATLIRFHEFDIFGTQELFKSQLDTLLGDLPGYDYIGVARDDGKQAGEHSAIFYNKDKFDMVDHGDFWLSETPEKPGLGWDAVCIRICTWGKFRQKSTGKEFLFFNLHMDHIGKTARVESAKLIKSMILEMNSLPTILTGDFNVDQHSPSYATIIEGGMLTDTHDRAPLVYQTNGTFNDYQTDGYTDQRIDHIFVSPSIGVSKYGVLTDTYRTPRPDSEARKSGAAPQEVGIYNYVARTPSDHFPVVATIKLP